MAKQPTKARTKVRGKKTAGDSQVDYSAVEQNAARIVTAAADKAAGIVAEATAKAAALVSEAATKAAAVVDGPSLRSQIAAEAAHAAITELTTGPVLQDIVNKAVDMGLERLGFRTTDKDAMQDNMRHLAAWVDTMKIIRTRGIGTATIAIVSFLLATIGYGLLHWLPLPFSATLTK